VRAGSLSAGRFSREGAAGMGMPALQRREAMVWERSGKVVVRMAGRAMRRISQGCWRPERRRRPVSRRRRRARLRWTAFGNLPVVETARRGRGGDDSSGERRRA